MADPEVEQVSEGAVALHRVGAAIAETVLSRAGKLNAINRAMLRGLAAAAKYAESDPAVRAVVIRGEGRAFSAGGDLEEVGALVHDRTAFSEFLDEWHATFSLIENLRVPVVAAVHGFAFAGGFELMQVCDLVVVGDRTTVGDQHANYGLFPAGGSTQRLPRQIPRRAATWMLLSGEGIGAAEAVALGLANRVVPETQVRAAAVEMATVIAGKSPRGMAAIKKALRLGAGLDLTAALAAERATAVEHMASGDVQKGLAAFRARTTPEFT